MAYDEKLATRIRQAMARRKGLVEKKMFGGVGFLLAGNMCVGVWKQQLIVRLAAEDAELAILEPHVHPFDITGKPMKGWLLVDPAGVEKDADLKDWIGRAASFVATLPAK